MWHASDLDAASDVGHTGDDRVHGGLFQQCISVGSVPMKRARRTSATTLRHYVRLTTAARASAVAGLDEVTRAAFEDESEEHADSGRLAGAVAPE